MRETSKSTTSNVDEQRLLDAFAALSGSARAKLLAMITDAQDVPAKEASDGE